MLKYGNEEFRNLQEQVEKNKDDITSLKQGGMGHDPIPGPQGEQGPQGPQGPKGDTGPALYGMAQYLPSATAYIEGDFYLLSNGNLYKKIGEEWVLQGSLRGPQGIQGEDGDEVTANPVQSPTGGPLNTIKIDGIVYSVGGGGGELTPEALAEILEGSETVVVDFNLEGDKLEVRLDNDYKNICDRALLVPMSAPADHKLVGIDTSNGQELIGIGSGLEISGGNLVATGGGGGGGSTLYKHTCQFTFGGGGATGIKITDSSTPFTAGLLSNFDGMGVTTSIGFGGVLVTDSGQITLLYGASQSTGLSFVSDTVTTIS